MAAIRVTAVSSIFLPGEFLEYSIIRRKRRRDGERNQHQSQQADTDGLRGGGYAAALRYFRRIEFTGAEIWLRTWSMRVLFGSHKWGRNAIVHDGGLYRPGQIHYDA